MLKIQHVAREGVDVFTLSGRIEGAQVAELQQLSALWSYLGAVRSPMTCERSNMPAISTEDYELGSGPEAEAR
jgi:hypothetical protein